MQSLKHSVCSGFCKACRMDHQLPTNDVIEAKAVELMDRFEKMGTIDIFSRQPDKKYSTESLFDEPRGKMFGLLQGIDRGGEQVFLYAFSGQYRGSWLIKGWAPPLFDPDHFAEVNNKTERKIKKLTRHIQKLDQPAHQHLRKILKSRRKQMSQQLMKEIHGLYYLHNFKGEFKTLEEVFDGETGIPTGTGDCCAPKLLNASMKQSIKPVALTEFYWGKENKSKTKLHKHFYPSCREKCAPILGFMLCGSNQLR